MCGHLSVVPSLWPLDVPLMVLDVWLPFLPVTNLFQIVVSDRL